jgi:hypothetical protein
MTVLQDQLDEIAASSRYVKRNAPAISGLE